jgi:charged multivesicular body protein 1
MEAQLFNLKFTAKQLERQSKKSTKEEAQDKAKLKKVFMLLIGYSTR